MTAEEIRLKEAQERKVHWKRWGPYLSERSWGTVREHYSQEKSPWDDFPHDHARFRAYRWNDDGLAGISDLRQDICFALAMWNGRDPFLKERLFGLTGPQGNRGEDVKEYYFYLDSSPTHSYMKYLYKYPQERFPYELLVEESRRRTKQDSEYELLDTGIFDDDRYFDVFVEYAKADAEDIFIRVEAINRGPEPAVLHLLPTIWFRNTWSWRRIGAKPALRAAKRNIVRVEHPRHPTRWLYSGGNSQWLFTENETNFQRLYGTPNPSPYVKDGINAFVVDGKPDAVNAQQFGTKAAAHSVTTVDPGKSCVLRLRFSWRELDPAAALTDLDAVMEARISETDQFYATRIPPELSPDARNVMRQAFAGLLWTKQFYHYVIEEWLKGDPAFPPPTRRPGPNDDWVHLHNADVISMPDKWEFPWYAVWDLAFHCIPFALIDSEFAKGQLILFLREWYMHANGQIPAYEWALEDVNPPVHAWAVWRVYHIEQRQWGSSDRSFLERAFHKLLLNFTWWVNRKDPDGRNVFQGGFLGLDNIGIFDRSAPISGIGRLEQADATGWMAMYALNMLSIAAELARENPSYEGVASKFFEHFLYIAHAKNKLGLDAVGLWDEEDGFYYDLLHLPDGRYIPLKVRSMVGLIPLFAVDTLDADVIDRMPDFQRRMNWFLRNRSGIVQAFATQREAAGRKRWLLSVVGEHQLRRVLKVMLDEKEFLSEYGIRSLSKYYQEHPYTIELNGSQHRIEYEPAESTTHMFGGNSNWRGPVWLPVNFLIIESLQKFHHFYGNAFQIECPTGSDRMMNLWQVAQEICRRLSRIFMQDGDGRRPLYGATDRFNEDPRWRDLLLFHEYFHGDLGNGLGASHQTGWTALIAKLMQQNGKALGL